MGVCTSRDDQSDLVAQNKKLQTQVENLEARLKAQSKTRDFGAKAPAAVALCEGETVDWMNAILAKMWPRVDGAVQKIVHEQVTPMINEKIAKISRFAGKVEFEQFTIGEKSPVLGPIRVFELEDGLKVHLHIDYVSDVDISIKWGPVMRVGIEKLRFQGEVVIKLGPLIDEVPVIGGLNVYFYNCPQIGMDFTGAANVADCPGVNSILWRTVTSILSDMMVLPNVLGIPVGSPEQVDHTLIMCPEPVAMLRVSAKSAAGLKGLDWNLLGKATSDPLIHVTIADTTWVSPAVHKTCDPEWPEGTFFEFMVFDREQTIRAMVLDDDVMGGDDVLGYSEAIMVGDAEEHSGKPIKLYSKQPDGSEPLDSCEDCGSLTLQFEWMALESPQESLKSTSEQAVVVVKMTHVVVPWSIAESVPAVALQATIGDVVKTTLPGTEPAKPADDPEAKKQQEMLHGIVHRLSEGKVDQKLIASATKLHEEQVDRVAKGGHLGEADIPTPEIKRYVVNGALYFVVERKAISGDAPLKLEIVDKGGKVLAEVSTTVEKGATETYCTQARAKAMAMPGPGGEEIEACISVAVRGLD